jgi:hypothetical protein
MATQDATKTRTRSDPPSADRRATLITAAMQADELGQHYVPTEDGYLALPVTRVPPEALVYRADNGRILSELAHAAHARATTVAALKARGESAEVQDLLGTLLLEKARDPEGPIYDELARYGHQTEPLLTTRDGLVVNGNRRLAAMTALAEADPRTYADFASVRVAVLPAEIGRDRLEYIEAALQMAPELKLSYSWINRRLKLRQHVADLDRDRVAKAYRFKDPADIEVELEELALAEDYLAWRGAPEEFDEVAHREEDFVRFNKQLKALKAAHVVQLWKRIGFVLLRAADELDRPIDHYFPFAAPAPRAIVHWVPRVFAADLGLTDRPEPGQVKSLKAPLAGELSTRLDQTADPARTARTIMGLIDTLKSNEETYLGPDRVVHHLRMARDAMEALDRETMPDRQLRRVQAEMAALGQHLDALRAGRRDGRPMARATERRLPPAARWLVRKARRIRGS